MAAAELTVLGLGSLISERSSRLTFPNLRNFRQVRVTGFRRVFAHPARIFFDRKIANFETLEFSSLSAEEAEGVSFLATAFEVDGVVPDFEKREEEFELRMVPFEGLNGGPCGTGLLCCRSTDEAVRAKWGDHIHDGLRAFGVETIWGWSPDSGLKPCPVYARHCLLAARSLGPEMEKSFLEDTWLIDRKTTFGEHVLQHPELENTLPPPELAERYSG
eukprot:TRINITY_DN17903_c1_g4_i7.p1 TRINITY_DN17903_c1_g4~~TRINITY_DN17903_c1_g4_i7.p1  ORF type:complete len:218 (+),score=43.10 TRINITY_DN17903_c1_g4_i7:130-783(+)